MMLLLMVLTPLTNLCLAGSEMEDAMNSYPISILSTLILQKIPVDQQIHTFEKSENLD